MKGPLVFNIFKPARMTSYDVIRVFKKTLGKGHGKIGHFGTLDPFASGVLLLGVGGAARLNNYIHDYLPKTYLAVGKLGVSTPTGDLTVPPSQVDEGVYLRQTLAQLSPEYIQTKLREKFLGSYWQAPPQFSAAKHEGKPLYEWARQGVDIKKEKKERHIYHLEVVKYRFPYLSLRVVVSSGTYIRVLFSDMANTLGTIGSLQALVRESIGPLSFQKALKKKHWPRPESGTAELLQRALTPLQVLPFSSVTLSSELAKKFGHGQALNTELISNLSCSEGSLLEAPYLWVNNQDQVLLGLAKREDQLLRPVLNFSCSS